MSNKKTEAQSEYIAFLDESGDHSLGNVDLGFPIFVLSMVLMKRQTCGEDILAKLNQLKLKYWDHEGINFHSRDIRKKQSEFSELVTRGTYSDFVNDLSQLMKSLEYEVFMVIIHKEKLNQQYKQADNHYDLSLKFLMERVVACTNERCIGRLPIIAEARGKNEDNQLKAVFFDLVSRGTEDFQNCQFSIEFENKKKNIGGIQLADLCAYPCGRYALDSSKPNPAYEILLMKLSKSVFMRVA